MQLKTSLDFDVFDLYQPMVLEMEFLYMMYYLRGQWYNWILLTANFQYTAVFCAAVTDGRVCQTFLSVHLHQESSFQEDHIYK